MRGFLSVARATQLAGINVKKRREEAREMNRSRERERERFARKWRGFPGFGISIRNIGRCWLWGAAARNLEFPLVIKSYPLQRNTSWLSVSGRGERRGEERRIQMERLMDGGRRTTVDFVRRRGSRGLEKRG